MSRGIDGRRSTAPERNDRHGFKQFMKVAYHYSYSFADDIAVEIIRRVCGDPGIEGVNLYQGDQPATSEDRPGVLARVSRRVGRRVRSALGIKGAGQEPRLLSLGSIF